MITISELKGSTKGSEYFIGEIRGLSTDTKPTEMEGYEIVNGCIFIEIDTGDMYMYDAENEEWNKI